MTLVKSDWCCGWPLQGLVAAGLLLGCGSSSPSAILPFHSVSMTSSGSTAHAVWNLVLEVSSRRLHGVAPDLANPAQPPLAIDRILSQDEFRPLMERLNALTSGPGAQCTSGPDDLGGGASGIQVVDARHQTFRLSIRPFGQSNEICIALTRAQHLELFELFPDR